MKQEKSVKLKPKKNAFRIAIWGSFCIALIITFCIPLLRIGMDIYQKYQEYAELEKKLTDLKKEESVLTMDVKKMQDPEYIARHLRENFLYSRDGEFVIRIPE